jgi:hypothetical protein
MSIILATWKAELWRIVVQGQPGQIVQEDPHLQNNWNARHQWFTPIILATQEAEIRRTEDRSQPAT